MEKQQNFTDIEYTNRRRTTKREAFLEKWMLLCLGVRGYHWLFLITLTASVAASRCMTMLQTWFNLSDEGIEDTIYDSYAMKTFMGIDFSAGKQVPDATTLCRFRKLLNDHGLQKEFFDQVQELLAQEGKLVSGGTIVDAIIVEAPNSTKNRDKKRDPEMHSTRKNTKWYYGMRVHIGTDPYYGFVHTIISTAANEAEGKVAPRLLREDDAVVYGDAGYLKMNKYATDGIDREYKINRQRGTFKRHYGDDLAWVYEKELEKRKSSVRCKVEYVFHIVKDIFHWRKTRYKGIHKNDCHAHLLFASVNLYMMAMG